QGWRWQGLAWHGGPALEMLVWREGDCARLTARNVRVSKAWPLQLVVGRVKIGSCGAATDTDAGSLVLPTAPPFDVTVEALAFGDYPTVRAVAHHRGARWWGRVSRAGSHVQGSYDADSRRWRLDGRVAVTDIHP